MVHNSSGWNIGLRGDESHCLDLLGQHVFIISIPPVGGAMAGDHDYPALDLTRGWIADLHDEHPVKGALSCADNFHGEFAICRMALRERKAQDLDDGRIVDLVNDIPLTTTGVVFAAIRFLDRVIAPEPGLDLLEYPSDLLA